MNEWGVVMVIASVLALVGTFYTMFYKPMHELNVTMKVLIANNEHIKENNLVRDQRLNRHGDRLDSHETRIVKLESTNFIKDRVQ